MSSVSIVVFEFVLMQSRERWKGAQVLNKTTWGITLDQLAIIYRCK